MAKHKQQKNKSILAKLMTKGIILTIQLFISIVFMGCVYVLKIVPSKYFLVMIALLSVLWILSALYMRSGTKIKKKTGRGIQLAISKLVSVMISLVLVIGSIYMVEGNDFLSKITSAFTQTHNIAIYALLDSDIEKVEDIVDKTVGTSYKEDSTYVTQGIAQFEEELGTSANIKEIEGCAALADSLYDEEVDCIIVDQAYLSLLESDHEDFEAETKIIATYKIVEKVRSVTTKTDVTESPFIVFLQGIDTYGDVSTVSRSDVNLVLVVNPKEKQILMVSVPRDTQVTLASFNAMDKLTHSAMYGIDETIETLENFFEIDFNYYAKTNFSGIIDIIDALDGVEVDSPNAFTTMHGNINIVEGINELDGAQALCFARERYAFLDGDFQRGKNQQLLLAAILKKAMSSKIITNYTGILSAIEGCFVTDMTSDDIKSLINMQLDDMSSWEIFNVQVAGYEEMAKTYSDPNKYASTQVPDEEVLEGIISVIDKMEAGKKITDKDIEGLY